MSIAVSTSGQGNTSTGVLGTSLTIAVVATGLATMVVAMPLLVSLFGGGLAPMLILTAYLYSVIPVVAAAAAALTIVALASAGVRAWRRRNDNGTFAYMDQVV